MYESERCMTKINEALRVCSLFLYMSLYYLVIFPDKTQDILDSPMSHLCHCSKLFNHIWQLYTLGVGKFFPHA